MRGMSSIEAVASIAFAAGRSGVLEIGRKLQKRLQTSKSPHLQAAKAKRCFARFADAPFKFPMMRNFLPYWTSCATYSRKRENGGLVTTMSASFSKLLLLS